jgi:hypothetical protein
VMSKATWESRSSGSSLKQTGLAARTDQKGFCDVKTNYGHQPTYLHRLC